MQKPASTLLKHLALKNRMSGMYKLLFYLLASMLVQDARSQTGDLVQLNQQRERTNKTGLAILGGWSAANLVLSSIAYNNTTGRAKSFHQMNVYWNMVNLGVSTVGFLTAKKEATLSLAESLKKQGKVEKLFLLNAGLDVAYIVGGLYLKEYAKRPGKDRDRYTGYGQSVMLQGSALLLFDSIMYAINNQNGKGLLKMTEKLQVAIDGNGLGIVVGL